MSMDGSVGDCVSVKWLHDGSYRRFRLPVSSECDMHALLLQKVKAVVPDFDGTFAWQDEDGDEILFSTHDELTDALRLPANQQVFRIRTAEKKAEKKQTEQEASDKQSEKEPHSGVECDLCDKAVMGIRYKCAICPDYDLCEQCERSGQHAEHPMIRYASPRTPMLNEFTRFRRHPHRRCTRGAGGGGFRSPFHESGIFQQCPAAAEAAATASDVANAANRAALAAAQRAANAFAQNMNRTQSQEQTQHFRDSLITGVDYLREVGAQVQQALSNFGIEVDMDVEHEGTRERVPRPTEEPKANGDTQKEKEPNKEGAEKRANEQSEKNTASEVVNLERDVEVPMKKMHISEQIQSDETNKEQDTTDGTNKEQDNSEHSSDNHDDMEAWTMMDGDTCHSPLTVESAVPMYPNLNGTGTRCMAGTPFVVLPPGPHNPHCLFIHPDKRVAECVAQLESMGFDNCNGWLTKLASSHNGDTTTVIEALTNDSIYAARLNSI